MGFNISGYHLLSSVAKGLAGLQHSIGFSHAGRISQKDLAFLSLLLPLFFLFTELFKRSSGFGLFSSI